MGQLGYPIDHWPMHLVSFLDVALVKAWAVRLHDQVSVAYASAVEAAVNLVFVVQLLCLIRTLLSVLHDRQPSQLVVGDQA